MLLHPALQAVADRYRELDEAIRNGTLQLPSAIGSYAWVSKRAENTLAVAHLNSTTPEDVDNSAHAISAVITDDSEDRDGDIVDPRGGQFEEYGRNPVVFFGHQELAIPIAKSKSPDGRITVYPSENDVRATAFFDIEDSDSMFIYGKIQRGFISATSVAFVPIEAFRRERHLEKGDFDKAKPHRDPNAPLGWRFKRWSATEWSWVGVGSNPKAIRIGGEVRGSFRDVYDSERSFMSPRLQKAWAPYMAKSVNESGGCWTGWCPLPDGSGCAPCSVVKALTKTKESEPSPAEEAPTYWDVYVDGRRWATEEGVDEDSVLQYVKYRLGDAKAKIELRGPYTMKQLAADSVPKERWNKSFPSIFDGTDVQMSEPEAVGASTTYRIAASYLGCPIKDLFQNGTRVPSPRMGSFLTGLKHALADYRCVEVRNFREGHNNKDREAPPVYETIQLNSKLRDSFLLQGSGFYEGAIPIKRGRPMQVYKGSGPHNIMGRTTGTRFVVKFEPIWNGLDVTLFTKNCQAAISQQLLDSAWTFAKERNFLKGEAFALSGDFLPRTDEDWQDVFLEEKNKIAVQRTLDLFNEKKLNFACRGTILTGPPGTGKTLSSRIIRNKAQGTFIWVSSRDFHASGSVGGLTVAFEMAKELAPAVICMEDVDNWLHPTTIDLMKSEMDGVSKSKGVWTVLTTNFPEKLPDALIDRPGRFHDVLNFNLPSDDCRKAMLTKWLPKVKAGAVEAAVKKTGGYSGAHVYELAKFAETLNEHDGLEPEKALEKAIEKVEEQRDLITKLQLEGSNYDPLRNSRRSHKYADEDELPMSSGVYSKSFKGGVKKAGCGCKDCKEGGECPCEKGKDKQIESTDMTSLKAFFSDLPVDVKDGLGVWVNKDNHKVVVDLSDWWASDLKRGEAKQWQDRIEAACKEWCGDDGEVIFHNEQGVPDGEGWEEVEWGQVKRSLGRHVRKYITHTGSKWIVHAEDGHILGKHDTQEEAQAQLRAVEASKHGTSNKEIGGMTGGGQDLDKPNSTSQPLLDKKKQAPTVQADLETMRGSAGEIDRTRPSKDELTEDDKRKLEEVSHLMRQGAERKGSPLDEIAFRRWFQLLTDIGPDKINEAMRYLSGLGRKSAKTSVRKNLLTVRRLRAEKGGFIECPDEEGWYVFDGDAPVDGPYDTWDEADREGKKLQDKAKSLDVSAQGKPYAWQQGFVAGLGGSPNSPPASLESKFVGQWKSGWKAGAKLREENSPFRKGLKWRNGKWVKVSKQNEGPYRHPHGYDENSYYILSVPFGDGRAFRVVRHDQEPGDGQLFPTLAEARRWLREQGLSRGKAKHTKSPMNSASGTEGGYTIPSGDAGGMSKSCTKCGGVMKKSKGGQSVCTKCGYSEPIPSSDRKVKP